MRKLTTEQAIDTLLTDENYLDTWLRSGYSKPDRQRYILRKRLGKMSLEKMDELLTTCGMAVAQDKQWILTPKR